MNRSESIAALSKALAAAQAKYTATGKDRTANIASAKGSFRYSYADLAAVVAASRPALAENGLSTRDLDLLVLHQSNLRMLEAIMTSLELPMERTVTTVESYGNTAAASIPLTLQKAAAEGRLTPGSRVMLCGFGGGLSWGAALVDW